MRASEAEKNIKKRGKITEANWYKHLPSGNWMCIVHIDDEIYIDGKLVYENK